MNISIDSGLVSKHRTAIMGVATLMIIACHASSGNVVMPSIIKNLLILGNFGVDIFLFVSGIGCFYSLSKTPIDEFYIKRLKRVFIPYWILTIPFALAYYLLGECNGGGILGYLTTAGYWLHHDGAWYVALLVPLYLIAPLLYHLLKNEKSGFLIAIVLTLGVIALFNIVNPEKDSESILYNTMVALRRVPSFFLGMYMARFCKSESKVNCLLLLLPVLAFVVLSFLHLIPKYNLSYNSIFSPLVVYVLALLLEKMSKHISMKPLDFCGRISLESYLTNIYLNYLLLAIIPNIISSPIFYGRYLEYTIIIVLGLTLAYYGNVCSNKLISLLE